jgi:hypothetical protein
MFVAGGLLLLVTPWLEDSGATRGYQGSIACAHLRRQRRPFPNEVGPASLLEYLKNTPTLRFAQDGHAANLDRSWEFRRCAKLQVFRFAQDGDICRSESAARAEVVL